MSILGYSEWSEPTPSIIIIREKVVITTSTNSEKALSANDHSPQCSSSGVVTTCATSRTALATITDQEHNQDLRLLALESVVFPSFRCKTC